METPDGGTMLPALPWKSGARLMIEDAASGKALKTSLPNNRFIRAARSSSFRHANRGFPLPASKSTHIAAQTSWRSKYFSRLVRHCATVANFQQSRKMNACAHRPNSKAQKVLCSKMTAYVCENKSVKQITVHACAEDKLGSQTNRVKQLCNSSWCATNSGER